MKQSGLIGSGMGKRTFFIAEELAFQDVLRYRRAVDGHKRAAAALAELVNGLGGQIFPRAGLPCYQDSVVGFGQHLDGLKHPLHGRAFAHHILEDIWLRTTGLQASVLVDKPTALQSLVQSQYQGVMLEGLGDEIIGTASNGFHRHIDLAEGGHHNHGLLRMVVFNHL